MAADTISQVLNEESGRIGLDILRKTVHVSPWLDLVQTGLFPEGMGSSIKVQTMGRALPTATDGTLSEGTWTDVTASAGYGAAGGSCLPTVTNVKSGSTTEEYNLQHTALEGDRFCVENLRNSFLRAKQLEAIKKNLADSTKHMLVERTRSEFSRLLDGANQILICADGVVEGSSQGTMPSGSGKAPGILTNDFLIDRYDALTFFGAGNSDLLMRMDGQPILPFITSGIISRRLKVESGFRDDIRWNKDMVGELFKAYSALGATSAPVHGFQHIIDPTPPRWQYSGGAWVRVWPYRRVAGDTGYVLEENPNYRTAAWQDSYVFHPEVFKMLFPSSIGDAGGGMSFQPVQYRGEWKFKNEVNLDSSSSAYNPDGTLGFFRAIFSSASEPLFTNYGYRIRHAVGRQPNSYYAANS